MKKILTIESVLIWNADQTKSFFSEFGDKINIIHGPNTSGKSTLILALLYGFGINDGNRYLKEIFDEQPTLKISCRLSGSKLIFIREKDTLYIKHDNQPLRIFNGISANQSAEHVKLKEFMAKLFDFNLRLESKNELKHGPIESMFLPYYVSQSVGWIYLRDSFSGLNFFKNFKDDYLDYYLGIESSEERIEKHRLESELRNINTQITVLGDFEGKNAELQLAKLADEEFVKTSNEYINNYRSRYKNLAKKEDQHVLASNELSYYQERKIVLQKVFRNHKLQQPESGECPTCSQTLPYSLSSKYIYEQEKNDTISNLENISAKIKEIQSRINSLDQEIAAERDIISNEYQVLKKYTNSDISFDKWIDNKANLEMLKNLNSRAGELALAKEKLLERLKAFKTDSQITELRANKSSLFRATFERFLEQLHVKKLEEDRYLNIYDITAFPYQGVELHLTILAYHFAFNTVISETTEIHRLPFILDAIFKEDLDDPTRKLILEFIKKNAPKDTQTIISIADTKDKIDKSSEYNSTIFNNSAKLIQIGDGLQKRSLLNQKAELHSKLIEETYAMIEESIN
ncbi:hypothetical protein L0U88_12120 [Flavihumibacter sp. RY-1]|uniref:AAA domain-containing protein n=2 Tax=Bacteroidota TaxID=976 RepID=A0ABS9BK47_9BACT|nr:hypothetical protein [Flavihumibacter fluminis]MCF1715373.1 hypothetical protein [Flavihumibacter fluminis]